MSLPRDCTQPPWTVCHFVDETKYDYEPTEQGLYEIEEANEQIIAAIKDGYTIEAEKMADANRALIAAAPFLYLALEEVAAGEWLDDHQDEGPAPEGWKSDRLISAVSAMEAALALARGEEVNP